MNTKFEEVLIENPIEQEQGFAFHSQEDQFTEDNIYEMNIDLNIDNTFNHDFPSINYEELGNHQIELAIESSSIAQIHNDKKQPEAIKEEENIRNQFKHFTSSLKYPSISLSNSTTPQIENVVITANLKCQLNLRHIALKTANTAYDPDVFGGLTMRIAEPQLTAYIFPNGKIICTGTKSEGKARKGIRKVAKIVHRLGYSIRLSDVRIQNLIGAININQPINLKDFAMKNNQFCSYNPELFLGLIFKLTHLGIITILFSTGEMLFTGSNDRSTINKAFASIYAILQQYRKRSSEIRML